MENFYAGMKLTENQVTDSLVNWLNITQHFMKDIDEGEYKYEIVKTPELPIEIKKENLREIREIECFSIVNRGKIWYDGLTDDQQRELAEWYNAWLDVTNTMIKPTTPGWLK